MKTVASVPVLGVIVALVIEGALLSMVTAALVTGVPFTSPSFGVTVQAMASPESKLEEVLFLGQRQIGPELMLQFARRGVFPVLLVEPEILKRGGPVAQFGCEIDLRPTRGNQETKHPDRQPKVSEKRRHVEKRWVTAHGGNIC